MISANRGNYNEGREQFLKALEMTNDNNNGPIYRDAKCGFAISNAECSMDQYLGHYGEQIK